MRRVVLVRHGSHDRLGRILCGRMPGVSLSEAGRAEARATAAALGRRLGSVEGVMLVASPRERTQETAAGIADVLGLAVGTDAAIDEIDFGAWTGRRLADLAGDDGWDAWNARRGSSRPPGGESMGEVQARIGARLDRLAREEAPPVILVSHGDVIRGAILHLLGLPLDAYDRIVVGPASWSELDLWPGGGRVVSLNERAAP